MLNSNLQELIGALTIPCFRFLFNAPPIWRLRRILGQRLWQAKTLSILFYVSHLECVPWQANYEPPTVIQSTLVEAYSQIAIVLALAPMSPILIPFTALILALEIRITRFDMCEYGHTIKMIARPGMLHDVSFVIAEFLGVILIIGFHYFAELHPASQWIVYVGIPVSLVLGFGTAKYGLVNTAKAAPHETPSLAVGMAHQGADTPGDDQPLSAPNAAVPHGGHSLAVDMTDQGADTPGEAQPALGGNGIVDEDVSVFNACMPSSGCTARW